MGKYQVILKSIEAGRRV